VWTEITKEFNASQLINQEVKNYVEKLFGTLIINKLNYSRMLSSLRVVSRS